MLFLITFVQVPRFLDKSLLQTKTITWYLLSHLNKLFANFHHKNNIIWASFRKKVFQRQILVQITHHKIVGQGNSSCSFLLEKPKVRLVSLVIGLQWSQFSTFDWFSAHLARAISGENLMAQKSNMTDNCLKLYDFSADVVFFYLGKQLCLLPPTLGNTVVFSQKKSCTNVSFFLLIHMC